MECIAGLDDRKACGVQCVAYNTSLMLKLYQYTGCPYCAKVIKAIDELGLDVELVDASWGNENSDQIEAWTGRRTVPFLVDEEADVKMHESEDIIAYLREKAGAIQ